MAAKKEKKTNEEKSGRYKQNDALKRSERKARKRERRLKQVHSKVKINVRQQILRTKERRAC